LVLLKQHPLREVEANLLKLDLLKRHHPQEMVLTRQSNCIRLQEPLVVLEAARSLQPESTPRLEVLLQMEVAQQAEVQLDYIHLREQQAVLELVLQIHCISNQKQQVLQALEYRLLRLDSQEQHRLLVTAVSLPRLDLQEQHPVPAMEVNLLRLDLLKQQRLLVLERNQ
jgi:hypothetical protein